MTTMRKTALFAALLIVACVPKGYTGLDPAAPEHNPFPVAVGPYLVRIDPGRVAVVFGDSVRAAPIVESWLAETGTTAPAEPAHYTTAKDIDGLWVATLEHLPPDREIRYRIRSGETVVGPLGFKAAVSRGQKLRFAVFGDTRTGHQVHSELIQAISKEAVDFSINSGDLVEFGGVDEQWEIYFRIESPLVSKSLQIPVIGNHDDAPRGLYERYFLLQLWNGGRRYFVQDWGDVRVVALDTQIELRRGSEQYAFAERALREGAKAGQLMVMAMHYPPFSSGQHGSSLEVREMVTELAARFGVELVVAGHDHDYERTQPIAGTTYLVAASAGANIRRVSPGEFTAEMRTQPHYIIIDVEKGGMVGRAIDLAGNTFDSFVIAPNPPQESK